MIGKKTLTRLILITGLILMWAYPAVAAVNVQCPGDNNGDAVIDGNGDPNHPNAKCMHLIAGDGFVTMADGRSQYMFGYEDITGTKENKAIQKGTLAATFPAPKIVLDEGDEFYLNLTNVGILASLKNIHSSASLFIFLEVPKDGPLGSNFAKNFPNKADAIVMNYCPKLPQKVFI